MIETVFRSDDLPPAQRLTRFDEFQVESLHPMRVFGDPGDFHATARALDLAAVNIVELACSPAEVRRTPKLIRQADPEVLSVILVLRGSLGVAQGDHAAVLGAHDFALYDSSRPFQLHIAADDGLATVVRAHLPRALVPLSVQETDRLLAVPLSGRQGMGALLANFLTSLTRDSASYRMTDTPRLSGLAVDLMTASLAHHLDAGARVIDDSRQRTVLLRVETFIQQHLHEPRLSPANIAEALHISVSYLHRLFQTRDTTVSAWIRRQRLERARRDLADPGMGRVPIHRIAARWGFNDHASFTRAFRTVYDIPPKDYRYHQLGLPNYSVSRSS